MEIEVKKDMPAPAQDEFNVLSELRQRMDSSTKKLNQLHADLYRIKRNIAVKEREHEFLTKLFKELKRVTRS